MNQPIIPPWETTTALSASESRSRDEEDEDRKRIQLIEKLDLSDLAFRLPQLPADTPQRDQLPLVIVVEDLLGDPALAQLRAAEQARSLALQNGLPEVERPEEAPDELSIEDLRVRLQMAQDAVRSTPSAGGRQP
ncbi:hypothetical protein [Cyanobium sp. CH-040]|uniref:hypothetical protein n=1 Tax=Cyanobium sp. CH-040 TaxID=2823708 RepID=UPI0020CC0DA8|nr:hypothetical protein [Cyanobium sp. CH-040]MCP9927027.1 hypothetical protein [Cyanobium sp. CH-040]